MGTCSKDIVAQMRERVDIQAVLQAPDGQGGYDELWANELTVWAKIEPMKGFEKLQAMQLGELLTHKVTMRYNDTVTTKHRLKLGTRTFAIKEVINQDESDSFLILRCVEG